MRSVPRVLCWLCLSLTLALTGCERAGGLPFTSEETDPEYTRGKQLVRQGREQEALAAFLKVIAVRKDDAPESHLEAALLYQQHIKDPIAAIYHFRKFLELQPNSRQADLVRQRIDAAKREFARTLPAHPLEDASVKLEFMDQLERLQRENDQLKAELSALRAGLPEGAEPPAAPRLRSSSAAILPPVFEAPKPAAPRPAPATAATEPAAPPEMSAEAPVDEEPSPILHAPMPASPPPAAPSITSPVSRPPTVPSRPTSPVAAAGRRHVVGPGDTLYSLAQKYYGNRSKWREIYNANRDTLRSEGDKLRIGMELNLP